MEAPVFSLTQNRQAPQALAVSAATVGGASQFCRYKYNGLRLSRRSTLVVKLVCRPGADGRRPPAGRCVPAWARWAPGPRGGRVPRGTRVPPSGPPLGSWALGPPLGPMGPIS